MPRRPRRFPFGDPARPRSLALGLIASIVTFPIVLLAWAFLALLAGRDPSRRMWTLQDEHVFVGTAAVVASLGFVIVTGGWVVARRKVPAAERKRLVGRGGAVGATGVIVAAAGAAVLGLFLWSPIGATTLHNTSLPTVTGKPAVGQDLLATPGRWSGTPEIYSYNQLSGSPELCSYQWDRCRQARCVAIPYARGATYTPDALDIGRALRVQVTVRNAVSRSSARSRLTALVLPGGPPQNHIDAVTSAAEFATGRKVISVVCSTLSGPGLPTVATCSVGFSDGTCQIWRPERRAGSYAARRDPRATC